MNKNNDHISKEEVYRLRIAPIVDRIWEKDDVYQNELDKDEMIDYLLENIKHLTPVEFMAIPEQHLTKRFDQLISWKSIYGILSDLTPEQMKIFNDAIEGR